MTEIKVENLKEMEETLDKGQSYFIIYGNTKDWLPLDAGYIDLKEYLTLLLKERMIDIVIFFSIGRGISFPISSHEERFRNMCGHKKPGPKIENEDLLSASQKEELRGVFQVFQGFDGSSEPEFPTKLNAVLKMVFKISQSADEGSCRLAFIVEDAEMLAQPETMHLSEEDRINIATLRNIASNESSLVMLITKNIADIHHSLRGRGSPFDSVEIPLPRKEDRLAFICHLCAKEKLDLEMNMEELAHVTGGLTLKEIEKICKQSKKVTYQFLRKKKSQYLDEEFHDILRIMEPQTGLDGLGGMENIKAYCKELKRGFLKGDRRVVPPAIILMGPPGTGKTAFAEAIAYEWGMPFVEILNLRSMWVGESERIALKIMSALPTLYPCVVFWDEFDQEETSRGSHQGDSGVSSRLRKIRFQTISDPKNRGKFLVIYASNRPDLIDQADKRSGRASVRIPFLLPDPEEQAVIFSIMPSRYDFQTEVGDFMPLVNKLKKKHKDFISGADIEEISLIAYRHSSSLEREKVKNEDYLFAIDDFVPHHYAARATRMMEEMAVRERSSNRFLSKRGLGIVKRLERESSIDGERDY